MCIKRYYQQNKNEWEKIFANHISDYGYNTECIEKS